MTLYKRSLIHLRSWLRKLGVLKLIQSRLEPTVDVDALADEWGKSGSPSCTLVLGDLNFVVQTTSAQEYVSVQTKWASDHRLLAKLCAIVQPGDTIWDVGANVGIYSVCMAAACGKQGTVYAFEPEENSCCILEANVGLNRATNIHVMTVALGNKPGKASLAVHSSPHAGVHSLGSLPADGGECSRTQEVRVCTGDELVKAGDASQPNVVKIDVEGFEWEVIDGMTKTLSSSLCRAVLCEVGFARLAAEGKEFVPLEIEARLKSCGLSRQRWIDASHLLAQR